MCYGLKIKYLTDYEKGIEYILADFNEKSLNIKQNKGIPDSSTPFFNQTEAGSYPEMFGCFRIIRSQIPVMTEFGLDWSTIYKK